MADRSLFAEVADALRGFASQELGSLHSSHHRNGVKVWLGSAKAPREHYEAQVVGPGLVPGATNLVIEVGFHSEHPTEAENEAAIGELARSERRWRRELGDEPVLGPFLGRAGHWRRLSEVWLDPDLDDPELVFEVADRLTQYLGALEPCRNRPAAARNG